MRWRNYAYRGNYWKAHELGFNKSSTNSNSKQKVGTSTYYVKRNFSWSQSNDTSSCLCVSFFEIPTASSHRSRITVSIHTKLIPSGTTSVYLNVGTLLDLNWRLSYEPDLAFVKIVAITSLCQKGNFCTSVPDFNFWQLYGICTTFSTAWVRHNSSIHEEDPRDPRFYFSVFRHCLHFELGKRQTKWDRCSKIAWSIVYGTLFLTF